jgi:4-hydroxysphinganine ceramide fatty acyl 2-hydroxylase
MAKHYVSNDDVSVRMFKSDLLEKLTHVHPAVPHIIFVPVILYMLYSSVQAGLGIGGISAFFFGGFVFWTLTEYVMHRWVFHVKPEIEEQTREVLSKQSLDTPAWPALHGFTQTRYFVEHGVHHDFPNDSQRLVLPPGVSIPLAILFYYVFLWTIGPVSTAAAFAGFVTGYLFYDTTHYAVHNFRMKSKIGLYLKKHHFRHHYGDNRKDFGVSTPFWDIVFGSKGRKDPRVEG